MIDEISLHNYRGHTDTKIPCERLTVLVGENASGKTSVLKAVQWVSAGIGATLPGPLLRRGASEMKVVLTGRNQEGAFRIDPAYRPKEGKDDLEFKDGDVRNEDGSVGHRPFAMWLSLSADELAATSAPRSVKPELASSGRGLASVLAYLKLAETERFQSIVQRLRQVVPIVRDIGFSRVEVSETVPRLIRVEDRVVEISNTATTIQDSLVFDFADADKVPASFVSEGTLLALGMLTALETLDRDPWVETVNGTSVQHGPVDVVLIDDIDRALHPRAQRSLVAMLRAILDAAPSWQIIATSHSPFLVDALRPEEVVVLGRNAQGVVAAKRLDAFPDERLRKMLTTGELWMSEGDDWVAQ